MSRLKEFALGYFLTLASIVLVCILAEFLARFWLNTYADEQQYSRYAMFEQIKNNRNIKFERHHYLQYIGKPDYEANGDRHNDFGFRGEDVQLPKPSGVFRIALLGGSTTYTTSVPNYKYSYPYLLQQYLNKAGYNNIEVINAGLHAYSSWESLINFQFRVLDLQPDLIILYHGINDVHPRLVHPPNAYKGDNSGARVPYSPPFEEVWDNYSVALRIIRTKLGLRKPIVAGLGYRRTFEYVPNNYAEQFREQKIQGTYPAGIFRDVPALQMLKNNPPFYFERNINSIVAIAKQNNVEIILMTFAHSELFTEYPRVASKEYNFAFVEHNKVILSICQDNNLQCYDFAREMPKDKLYWTDGRHVNEEGADIKAQLVARYLIDHILKEPLQ